MQKKKGEINKGQMQQTKNANNGLILTYVDQYLEWIERKLAHLWIFNITIHIG